jgi:hypothetical protein
MFVIGFAATRWLGIVYTVFRYFGSCHFRRIIAYASELHAGYSAHPPPVAAAGEEAPQPLAGQNYVLAPAWNRSTLASVDLFFVLQLPLCVGVAIHSSSVPVLLFNTRLLSLSFY